MNLPTMCIVTAEIKDTMNLIWEALGRGSSTFSVPMNTIGFETTPTHFCMMDMGAQDSDVAIWQDLSEGILPDGFPFVENIISYEDAQISLSLNSLKVFSSNNEDLTSWISELWETLNLQLLSDESI